MINVIFLFGNLFIAILLSMMVNRFNNMSKELKRVNERITHVADDIISHNRIEIDYYKLGYEHGQKDAKEDIVKHF